LFVFGVNITGVVISVVGRAFCVIPTTYASISLTNAVNCVSAVFAFALSIEAGGVSTKVPVYVGVAEEPILPPVIVVAPPVVVIPEEESTA
jgi:hypothetical protein